MITLNNNGTLRFEHASFAHQLVLRIAAGGAEWLDAPLQRVQENRYETTYRDTHILIALEPAGNYCKYMMKAHSEHPVRIQFGIELLEAANPYPVIPAVLLGDNNIEHVVGRTRFPHLTAEPRDEPNCSAYWEFRADRASHPVSMCAFDGGIAAVSIDPYCDNAQGIETHDDSAFIRNGLFARAAHAGKPHAVGVTFGYRNTPWTYLNKTNFTAPTEHRFCCGEVQGTLHLTAGEDRRAAHRIIRDLHARYRAPSQTTLSDTEGMQRLVTGMIHAGWSAHGGNFADLKWDWENKKLAPFRGTNDEIAWTGGTQTALPLLIAGHRTGNRAATDRALAVLDFIAAPASINPRSGWLWDVCSRTKGRSIRGWWTPNVGEQHCAYTNGQALAYLLRGYKFARDKMELDRPEWRDIPLKVLEKAMAVQTPDGNFGYGYSTEDGGMIDPDGFAGCWFVVALAEAYELTGDPRYLDSASRGLSYYHRYVRDLCCWGTPMDTWKAIDQEGNLAFVRAARLLHQITRQPQYIEMLNDGAEYEYLWRFAIRARPQAPPLKNAPWNSCGGSITSTSNPHIHPMGILISGDLKYLAEHTGDDYHTRRLREGLDWALNCIELYPEHADYGSAGILTERFCPSDGLLIDQYPDGTPASVWFTHHIWAAANVLEGLLDAGAVRN